MFEQEPLPAGSPLKSLENVVLTDHVGWYTEESIVELKTGAARNVAEVLAGRPPVYPLNKVQATGRAGDSRPARRRWRKRNGAGLREIRRAHPAIAQDAVTGEVLMMALREPRVLGADAEDRHRPLLVAVAEQALEKGRVVGNVQEVKEIRVDCDADCVLFKVEQVGDAACHTGYRSCFYRVVRRRLVVDRIDGCSTRTRSTTRKGQVR